MSKEHDTSILDAELTTAETPAGIDRRTFMTSEGGLAVSVTLC